jgi:cob(I)alamin adenosyltransferase
MKIYTKTGDKGDTSLFSGQRVPKDALRVEAYGSIDELNSVLGVVLCDVKDPEIKDLLTSVQRILFDVGADLATPRPIEKRQVRRILPRDALPLEKAIDSFQERLKPLKAFILPGGTPSAARLHLARAVCRRAERVIVRLSRNEEIGEGILVYLNRLSDLLFTLARYANQSAGIADEKWKG